MPVDKVLWQTKRDAQRADLVLEEVVQWLNQVKVNALWKWNQVVVALNGCSLAACLTSAGLNNVRINGALCQELNAVQILSLVKEDLPELGTNQATLHLWLGNASQKLCVALLCVNVNQRHVELLAENLLNHLWLALTEHAMVNKHAGQLVANSAMDKSCDNRRVNAAGKRQNNAAIANLLANLLNLLLNDVVHGPSLLKTTDIEQEVRKHLGTAFGVINLWVELSGIQVLSSVFHSSDRAYVGRSGNGKALWDLRHSVAVTHPNGLLLSGAIKNATLPCASQMSWAILALLGVSNGAAQGNRHNLLSIAETKDRKAKFQDLWVNLWRILSVNRSRAAGQNKRRWIELTKLICGNITRNNLGVDVKITHTTCN